MTPDPGPVFLERRTYRRRRLADAARVLPLIGTALISVPLLWERSGDAAAPTAHVMVYLFVVWAALVGASALISARLRPEEDEADTPGER